MADSSAPQGSPGQTGGRRQADRRLQLHALVRDLCSVLLMPANQSHIMTAVEACVRQAFGVPDARIRVAEKGGNADWGTRPAPQISPSITMRRVAIPTRAAAASRYALELVPPLKRPFDAWDGQALETAGRLLGLVLEIARLSGAWPAAGARLDPLPRSRLIGVSPALRRLRETIDRVAPTDFTVVLEGESGTGKEIIAREIHERSRRRRGPFVAVNCAALVETLVEAELFGIEERTATGVRGRRGKFEHADGGTLFLDEVAELSPAAQAKLLRVLQDLSVERVGGHGTRTVDTRIIVATNRRLQEEVRRRAFREDLFYRLAGIEIRVAPLREHREDILILAEHFLERIRTDRVLALSPTAIDAMCAYDWPGNVRELERLIEAAAVLARTSTIEATDLPAHVSARTSEVLAPSMEQGDSLRAWARRYVRLMLERSGNNKRQACRVLKISYHTLQAYLRHSERSDRKQRRAGVQPLPPVTEGSARSGRVNV